MKCISVYTDQFDVFSDIYDRVRNTLLQDDEETIIGGVVVIESGSVPDHYLNRMRERPDVAVMQDKDQQVTILQRGDIFEILMPDKPTAIH